MPIEERVDRLVKEIREVRERVERIEEEIHFGPRVSIQRIVDDAVGFQYSGPGYPRITRLEPGVRRIQFNKDEFIDVEERYLPHLGGGSRPNVYPGVSVSEDKIEFHFAPGNVRQGHPQQMETETGLRDHEVEMLKKRFKALTPRERSDKFSGNACFYWHPEDMHLHPTQRRYAQGPCAMDPDGGENTFSTGAGRSEGYRNGTVGNPYRPWEDEDSEYFGYPVSEE